MSKSFNIDFVVECVKNIVDCNRCSICDKLEGSRSRFSCGHTTCDDCVAEVGDCLLCITPPATSTPNQVLDEPFTQRVTNTSALLKACQDTFNMDVYKRHRLSEQLKLEKEVFPQCIQAPVKYSNKRKTLNDSLIKEKRRSYLNGEQTSPFKGSKMEKSNYVQYWLEQSERSVVKSSPRRPFANLNVNHQRSPLKQSTPIKKRADIILDKVNENSENVIKRTNRKRKHFKTTHSLVENQLDLDQYLKPVEKRHSFPTKRLKKEFDQYENKDVSRKQDKIESGIVADIDIVVIEGSQSQTIDKDKQAWLAVLEAEKNQTTDSNSPLQLECSEIVKYTDDVEKTSPISFELEKQDTNVCSRVPFYKRSNLLETCNLCKSNKPELNQTAGQSDDVSITIESSTFITTIKVSNSAHNTFKVTDKHSTSVQTEINGLSDRNNDIPIKKLDTIKHELVKKSQKTEIEMQSQDLFTVESKILQEPKSNPVSYFQGSEVKNKAPDDASVVVVADSDSEDELNHSSIIQVTADIHRSSDQIDYGVLAEIDRKELDHRTRRGNRGLTPGSTDSSEKENYDPNRTKKSKFHKKPTQKKITKKHDIFDIHDINSINSFN